MKRTRLDILKGALGLVLLAAVIFVVYRLVDLPHPEALLRDVRGRGLAAVPLLVLVYAFCSMLPAPKAVLSIAAGAVFGLGPGLLGVMLGAVLGATAAFLAVRLLGGGKLIAGVDNVRLRQLHGEVARNGFLAVLLARLVPVIPFTTVNYAFGLTAVPLRSYVLATTIGIVPGATAYVAAGAYGTDPLSWSFLFAVGALLALTAIGGTYARRRRRSAAAGPGPEVGR